MMRRKIFDKDLKTLLDDVELGNLLEREGGFETKNNWHEMLSGGEK